MVGTTESRVTHRRNPRAVLALRFRNVCILWCQAPVEAAGVHQQVGRRPTARQPRAENTQRPRGHAVYAALHVKPGDLGKVRAEHFPALILWGFDAGVPQELHRFRRERGVFQANRRAHVVQQFEVGRRHTGQRHVFHHDDVATRRAGYTQHLLLKVHASVRTLPDDSPDLDAVQRADAGGFRRRALGPFLKVTPLQDFLRRHERGVAHILEPDGALEGHLGAAGALSLGWRCKEARVAWILPPSPWWSHHQRGAIDTHLVSQGALVIRLPPGQPQRPEQHGGDAYQQESGPPWFGSQVNLEHR